MLYDYECSNCGHLMQDVYQSIKDNAFTKCPQCSADSLNRIIHGGVYASVKDAKTIGQIADKNWSKLGRYKQSEIIESNKTQTHKGPSIFKDCGNATRQEISKMTQNQKIKYIMEGRK